MSAGIFFLVVGASGVGKDSLIDGAREILPDDKFTFAKRVITRPPNMGGEDYESLTPEEFQKSHDFGGFLITWSAHGYQYGLPRSLYDQQIGGRHIIANGSRAAIQALGDIVPNLVILNITADTKIRAERLLRRGRETKREIDERLNRPSPQYPEGIPVIDVSNNGTLAEGITRFVEAIMQSVQSHRQKNPEDLKL